jgi:hypothetical protein
MADVAHDASGPASPKPDDLVRQQASRPDLPDRGKLRVFISYSREDLDFADQLDAALNACGFECVIDRHDISGGEDWKRRLGNLISEADTVVFVLSPTSAHSEICAWEVEEAARLNKRILPVNCRPLGDASPPPRLRDLNYIFFYEDRKESPGSGFGTGLAILVRALNTDFDWLREHTRYLQRATEWDRGGRPANRLLSGDDILAAKAWAARRPKSAPEPTALQLDFIRASEEEAEARSNEQRKQLDAMAAAQAERETALHKAEEALKQAADAQRKRARVRNVAVALAASAVLLGYLWNRNMAREWGENTTATTAMTELGHLYENGLGVAQDYNKARWWYERAAALDDTAAMTELGKLYENGLGVAQDYNKARWWYERAADTLYEQGLGVAQDYNTARWWYERAAAKGGADAKVRLEKLGTR